MRQVRPAVEGESALPRNLELLPKLRVAARAPSLRAVRHGWGAVRMLMLPAAADADAPDAEIRRGASSKAGEAKDATRETRGRGHAPWDIRGRGGGCT